MEGSVRSNRSTAPSGGGPPVASRFSTPIAGVSNDRFDLRYYHGVSHNGVPMAALKAENDHTVTDRRLRFNQATGAFEFVCATEVPIGLDYFFGMVKSGLIGNGDTMILQCVDYDVFIQVTVSDARDATVPPTCGAPGPVWSMKTDHWSGSRENASLSRNPYFRFLPKAFSNLHRTVDPSGPCRPTFAMTAEEYAEYRSARFDAIMGHRQAVVDRGARAITNNIGRCARLPECGSTVGGGAAAQPNGTGGAAKPTPGSGNGMPPLLIRGSFARLFPSVMEWLQSPQARARQSVPPQILPPPRTPLVHGK